MESVINKLLEDVTIEILLRLPVRSLLQFKCVCKTWCNLIESSNFIEMHLNHPTDENDHHVLLKRGLQDRVTTLLSIHSNEESLSIVSPNLQTTHLDHVFFQLLGPCNGLVCITDYETFVLCNPATREFMLVPARPFGCPQDMYLSKRGAGFGFDANTNDYKVVRIVDLVDNNDYTDHVCKVEVYQRTTDLWRQIDYTPPPIWYTQCFEIFFNGATHWYAMRDGCEKVLSFNITTEVFQEFDFPDGYTSNDGNCNSLTVLYGCLSMIYYTDARGGIEHQFVDVWVMIIYGNPVSWAKKFTLGPLIPIIDHPITSWKNSNLLLAKTNGQLISCSLDTEEVKEFDIVAYRNTLRALVYKESLVSIKRLK